MFETERVARETEIVATAHAALAGVARETAARLADDVAELVKRVAAIEKVLAVQTARIAAYATAAAWAGPALLDMIRGGGSP